MFFDDLTGAKKSVQQLGKRAGLDASAKKHLYEALGLIQTMLRSFLGEIGPNLSLNFRGAVSGNVCLSKGCNGNDQSRIDR
jgi:hypothetical protein